jgi:hypothetical protein
MLKDLAYDPSPEIKALGVAEHFAFFYILTRELSTLVIDFESTEM